MIRYIFITLEIISLIIFIIPIFSGIFNPGNIIGIAVSFILIIVTIYLENIMIFCKNLWQGLGGKAIIILSSAVIAAIIIYFSIITGLMFNAQYKSPDNAKAIVVLGCKVNGEKPSRMLERRLESAYEFLNENKDVICVVSGGKGSDEQISEALAMKNYLLNKGISPDRILMEDKSENTYENLEFSADILQKYNINDIAIVTDGFHQYRAGYIAEKFGLESSAVNAETDMLTKWLVPTYWVREWLAVSHEYIKSQCS